MLLKEQGVHKEMVFTNPLIYSVNDLELLLGAKFCDGYWGGFLRESKKGICVISVVTSALLWMDTGSCWVKSAGRHGGVGGGRATACVRIIRKSFTEEVTLTGCLPTIYSGRGREEPAGAEGAAV